MRRLGQCVRGESIKLGRHHKLCAKACVNQHRAGNGGDHGRVLITFFPAPWSAMGSELLGFAAAVGASLQGLGAKSRVQKRASLLASIPSPSPPDAQGEAASVARFESRCFF
jgi:hypothetical protein